MKKIISRKVKGFTLVEVIVSLVVIAVIMYASLAVFITSGAKGVNVDVYTVAQALAEDMLEEAMVRDFVSVSSESETNFSGDLDGYSYEITVNYVSTEALDIVVGGPTDYKKINVQIRHPQLGRATSLESIRANYD
ncbi:MAG: prepilin-type N-terminal cleavage/methylation domain-containing protein [Candidatus Margulisiibacteriota bacterium]